MISHQILGTLSWTNPKMMMCPGMLMPVLPVHLFHGWGGRVLSSRTLPPISYLFSVVLSPYTHKFVYDIVWYTYVDTLYIYAYIYIYTHDVYSICTWIRTFKYDNHRWGVKENSRFFFLRCSGSLWWNKDPIHRQTRRVEGLGWSCAVSWLLICAVLSHEFSKGKSDFGRWFG